MKEQKKITKILVILTKSVSFLLFFIMQSLHLSAETSNSVRKSKASIWEIAYKRVTTLTGAQAISPMQIAASGHSNSFPCPGCHWANHCDRCYNFADCPRCHIFADCPSCHNFADCPQCHGVEECQSVHSCVTCYFAPDCVNCHIQADCPVCHAQADCPLCHWVRDCPTCHTVEYNYCPNETYPEYPRAQ